MSVAAVAETKSVHPFAIRDFRLLWIGESISLLGDQFYLIALPWLVLQLTGSALALGTVMALASIPRALFMIVGGALVDRFSPRSVMFASNLVRAVLVGLLALLVLSGGIQLWMLYLLALAFGTADAFFFPASSAILPALLKSDQLEMGNTLTQGMAMLSMFLGPVIAGVIISALAGTPTTADAVPGVEGIGVAFALDAASFLGSLVALWLIHPAKHTSDATPASVFASIKEGMRYVLDSVVLKVVFILLIAINLFSTGLFQIGIPVLADRNLTGGATAYGILMSAYGGGALLGVILAGVLPKPRPTRFGSALMVGVALLGIGMIILPFSTSTPVAALINLAMGTTMGYVNINFMTWLQRRVPEQLMGRVMSLTLFASVGIGPVSSALAGAIINVNLMLLFVGSGALLTIITLFTATMPVVRQMGLEVAETAPEPTTASRLRTTDTIPALKL